MSKSITQDMAYRQSLMKYAEKYGVSRASRKYNKSRSYIAVEIVVDFHAARLDGTAHGHRAAATEDIDEPAVVIRRQLVDDPQQLALATHPRNKAIQGASPPSSGRKS